MNRLECLILCAGKGTRLRPLTDLCPKPLLPIAGMTIADHALQACEALHPVRLLANAHHLTEQILAWAEARSLDHVQVEPVLLDTGGALARLAFEGELLADHLLVHNGDILHNIDLSEAWKTHLETQAAATLVVVDRPWVNTVVELDGIFAGVLGHPRAPLPPEGSRRWTFSGIAFYRTKDLGGDPQHPRSVKEIWHDFLEQSKRVVVWKAPIESRWDDLGTPDDLGRAIQEEIQRRGLVRWIDPDAHVHPNAHVGPGSAVEFGARLEAGASLENSFVFPGAEVLGSETLTNVLRNPGGDLAWDPR